MPVLPLELLSQDQQSQFDSFTQGLKQQGDQQRLGDYMDSLQQQQPPQALPPQNDIPQDVAPPSDVSPPDQAPDAAGGPSPSPAVAAPVASPAPAAYNASGQYGPDAQSSTPVPKAGQQWSPYDNVFRQYAGDLANDPEFIKIVAAGTKAESSWNTNSTTGDGGHSWGLFQMHDQGAGAGMGNARLDPNAASAVMVPRYADAYKYFTSQGLTGPALAAAVGHAAERNADASGSMYAAAYRSLGNEPAQAAATNVETNAGQPVGGSPQDTASLPRPPQVVGNNASKSPQDQFGDFLQNLTGGAQQAAQNAVQTVGSGLTAVGNGIASIGNSASQGVQQDPQAAFGSFVDGLKNGAAQGASAATQQLTGSTPDQLGQAASDLFSPSNPLTHTGQAITDAAAQVPQAVQDLGPKVGAAAGNALDAYRQTGLYQQASQLANTMPVGVAENMASGQRAAIDRGTQAIDKVSSGQPVSPQDWQDMATMGTIFAGASGEMSAPENGLPGLPRSPAPDAAPAQQRVVNAARQGAGEDIVQPPSLPAGKAADPVNQKLLDMYEQPPKVDAPTLGDRWGSIANWWAQNVTDDKAALQQLQDRAAKAKGAPLSADEMAASLSRLDPNMAARVNLEQNLAPALQAVGQDRPWLSVYLTHLDNIDVARATGQKVLAQAADAVPETNAALQNAQATLRGRQQVLDRLTADASTPESRIRAAQNSVNSAQRSVDAAQTKVETIRQQGLAQAAETGAQAAVDRSFSGGLSVADSQQGLANMRAQLGPDRMAKIEAAAKQVQDFNQSLLKAKRDAGLITPELYNALVERYPNYVPTRITDYLKDAADGPGLIPNGKSLSVRDAGLKANTIEGTTRAREDPLASTVRNAYATQALVQRNTAFNGFVKDADLAGRMGVEIRPIPDSYVATRDQAKVSGFVNGQRQTYVMPKALASMVKTEATSAIPGAAGTIWRGLMYAFKAGATSRNPLFLTANALNDAAVYTIRESSRAGGPQHLPQVLGELVKSYADAFKGMTLLGEGTYGGAATQRFLLGGGGQSGIFSGTEGAARETVENLSRTGGIPILGPTDLKGAIRDILTLRPVSNVGERVELAPRVASMRLAEQRGANPVQAVINGRNVTVDFSQGGTLSKVLNQFIPFFNAQVQGTTQIARAFKENPKAFTATVAALVGAPALAAEAWNRGDPQRAKDYADVPSYIKDQGIVVMLPVPPGTGRTGDAKPEFFYFPLREFAPLAVLTREAAGRVLGDAPRNWDDLMGGMLKSTSPVSGGTAGDTVTSLVPLGLNTGVQLATNQDFFRNRQIVSKNADENAAPSAQMLSMALQKAGIEAHPSQIEFMVRDLASGVGGAALAGTDMAVGGRTGPSQENRIQATPGVGGLVGRFVRDSTGQIGDTARQQTLTPSAKDLLRTAGVDLNLQPVGGSAAGVPLKGAEQTRYQQLSNQYVDEAIHRAPSYPQWQKGPAQRQAIVSALVSQAREKAAAEVLKQIPPDERHQRALSAQQQQQAGPWYYRAGEPVAVPSP